MKREYLEATFIKEGKHRFICTILINGVMKECYVSSSSKLSKYIDLNNLTVLVTKNNNLKLRTDYTLEAVTINGMYYYLNFNNANNLYQDFLISSGFN